MGLGVRYTTSSSGMPKTRRFSHSSDVNWSSQFTWPRGFKWMVTGTRAGGSFGTSR